MSSDDKRSDKRVFVTVGTTSFDKLIETVTSEEILQLLGDLGYSRLDLQIGRGLPPTINTEIGAKYGARGMTISHFRLKETISDDVIGADLVISHAGAGSILEALEANRPLVVVVNEELMGNHQVELARKLAEEENLVYCNCSCLASCLRSFDPKTLKPFQRGNPERLKEVLDDLMNFES